MRRLFGGLGNVPDPIDWIARFDLTALTLLGIIIASAVGMYLGNKMRRRHLRYDLSYEDQVRRLRGEKL